ncbi:hypothetical protein ACW5W8_08370 [Aeromonas aquatilis]
MNIEPISIIPIAISAGAFLVSLSAFIFTRRAWLETNRPIVTAEIATHDGGNEAIAFNLVIHNVGNRPATDIRLKATADAIQKLLDSNARDRFRKEVERCFTDEGRIAVLHPGKSVKNGFGLTSTDKEKNVLNYGASAQIEINYKDLNSRSYTSKLNLIVRDSAYFAGSGWAERE